MLSSALCVSSALQHHSWRQINDTTLCCLLSSQKQTPSPSMQRCCPFPEKPRILLLVFCYWVVDQELGFLWFGFFFCLFGWGFFEFSCIPWELLSRPEMFDVRCLCEMFAGCQALCSCKDKSSFLCWCYCLLVLGKIWGLFGFFCLFCNLFWFGFLCCFFL